MIYQRFYLKNNQILNNCEENIKETSVNLAKQKFNKIHILRRSTAIRNEQILEIGKL